jgi:hypothetical protein
MFNYKIIAMQTDWVGEYERLNSFFRTIGISHLVSCPHTHQQNGVAEHKHRHIVEMDLALLANAPMSLKYWDQAFLTATHLINRTPTKLLDYDTPLHCLLGATPTIQPFVYLGVPAGPIYAHTTHTSFSSDLSATPFLGTIIYIRGTSVSISPQDVSISLGTLCSTNLFFPSPNST